MGKGDQRSRRGKIHRGTFGKRRQKARKHKSGAATELSTEAATTKGKTKEPKLVKKQPAE